MVQSDKYYKSRAVDITSEVGLLLTDVVSELSLSQLLLNFRDTGSLVYEQPYNIILLCKYNQYYISCTCVQTI